MSVKKFGIYLCYAPGINLRNEGLGRYLAAFLKGAAERDDIKFVVVGPSWAKNALSELFESENVPADRFIIHTPARNPILLDLYNWYSERRKRKKKSSLTQIFLSKIRSIKDDITNHLEKRLINAYHPLDLLPLIIEAVAAIMLFLLASPFLLITAAPLLLINGAIKKLKIIIRSKFSKLYQRLFKTISSPKEDSLILRLYRNIEQAEGKRLSSLISDLVDVGAWYCPTAYWPEFNKINAPRLMCLPDVVLREFPIEFSKIGGDRTFTTFNLVENSIRTGDHFVTYSNVIKWNTLIDGYNIPAKNISVVHHAPNRLDPLLDISGLPDKDKASYQYARTLLLQALKKSNEHLYISAFENSSISFIFYASQIRPNKNIITLFRAYNTLLKKQYIQQKLIVTGNSNVLPEVNDFIKANNLQNDILFLHGLTMPELAACYKLATLAVNPSLSEGGCPFTFTEALSVDTPVVMSRIPVTEEVLTDPELQEMTFFDPYDWQDMANRIEWALNNRDILLDKQRLIYKQLATRNWTDVVNEHISILENISTSDKKTVAIE